MMTYCENEQLRYEAYLDDRRNKISLTLGTEATNLALAPLFALGIPEASTPRGIPDPEYIAPVVYAETSTQKLGNSALANVINLADHRDHKQALQRAVEPSPADRVA